MKITTKKILAGGMILGAMTLAFLFQAVLPAQAASLLEQQTGMDDIRAKFGTQDTDARIVAASFVKIFLGFLGIVFVILLIFAGFKYMTARDNAEEVKKALTTIRYAIIGIVLILVAWSIAVYVTDTLTKDIGKISLLEKFLV